MESVRYYHVKTSKGPYVIMGFSLLEATLEPMVTYQLRSLKDGSPEGPVWSRPVSEFFDGRFRQVIDHQDAISDAAMRGGLGVK